MLYRPRHFVLQELACPHIFEKYGETAWQFFDDKLLMTLDLLRDQLGPIYVNNWDMSPAKRKQAGTQLFDERGFRCIQCSIVKEHIKENILYVSPHMTGQGADFDVLGLSAPKVRLWCAANYILLPFSIRLEKSVPWVHLDTRDCGKGKVHLFT